MDSEIHLKLAVVRGQLENLKSCSQPNEPIPDFVFPDPPYVSEWILRLSNCNRHTLIAEITALLEGFELPEITDPSPRHDQLALYHHVSQLREGARAVLNTAMSLGYPHTLSVIAKMHDVAPNLTDIAGALDRIQNRIEVIEKQTLSNVSEGIAIAIGPISISLGALKRLAAAARKEIKTTEPEVNISVLVIALSRIAAISDEISHQLNKIVRKIPRPVRLALNEIIRFAYSIADKGVELMQIVRRKHLETRAQFEDVPQSIESHASPAQPQLTMQEVGKLLKEARVAANASITSVASTLKIEASYVNLMEEGQFAKFPGRTYAIGFVREYCEYLELDTSAILSAIRAELPEDWHRGTERLVPLPKSIGVKI